VTNRLRVTHAVLSLELGGLERLVLDLTREGRARGQDVSVLCLERPGVLAPRAEELGARVLCLNKRPGFRLSARRAVAAALGELRPDVLHTHQAAVLFYAGPAARAAGVPVVHTKHLNHLRKAGVGFFRRLRMAWLFWLAGRYADTFCCVSQDIADEMAARHLVAPQKLEVVLNGINTEPFRHPTDRAAVRAELGVPLDAPLVGTVGRLTEVKRQDLLLAAFARVRAAHPAAHLLVVGDGPLRGALEAQARALGIVGATHFVGYRPDPERYLGAMDAFALTSKLEGLPLAVLEAWAAGLPVVASAVGGVPDLIEDGSSGFLFPFGDEARLVARLCEVLADPARGAALGAAGRAAVFAHYDLRRTAADYEVLYRTALRTKAPNGRVAPVAPGPV